MVAKSKVIRNPTIAITARVTVQVFIASIPVNPLIYAYIQKPLSFIHAPH